MRLFLTVAFMLSVLPLSAQESAPKPNTLTPKEIAEGWLLLFDGESEFGWSSDGASIKVRDGKLEIKGAATQLSLARRSGEFQQFQLQYEFLLIGGTRVDVTLEVPG